MKDIPCFHCFKIVSSRISEFPAVFKMATQHRPRNIKQKYNVYNTTATPYHTTPDKAQLFSHSSNLQIDLVDRHLKSFKHTYIVRLVPGVLSIKKLSL